MTVFDLDAFDDHEQVVFCDDKESGLRAIISIHSTALGPAVGGCRMWQYASNNEALIDALRLSRGMTYKNAMAGLPFGGGKAVILGDSKTMKTEALFKSFGRYMQSLSGKYVTAEDVGINTSDMAIVHTETDYVAGLEGKSGDPSPFTAYGVFKGITAAVQHKFAHSSFKGLKVSVQGVGHVGYYLCEYLNAAGAELIVTDIDQDAVARVVKEFNATAVSTDAIYDQDVDVYAPCALGATINDDTINRLKCSIIAGAANNQLAEDRHGTELMKKGILYTPDYVINAGGIINISFEENYDKDAATSKVEEIYDTLTEVFETSARDGRPTNQIADQLARERIARAKRS
jgi:leucine dehydrogenase